MTSRVKSQPAARKSRGSESRGKRNIKWIEEWCRVPEGKDIGKPVKLRSWQKRDILKIYDNPAGTRRAIISFGKKNGKTSLAACLLLLHLCGPEAVPNTQLPSTAQSKEQAAVLFNLAAKMVRLNPALDAGQEGVVVIRDTIKNLFCPGMGTLYRALSAEVSTAHGQSPIFAIHDELGQVRGPTSELYNAIENAMGAHDAPLSIVISTQAPTDSDLLSILIDDALTGEDPSTVLSLYTAPLDLDPFSDKALKLANPALGDFLNAKEIRKQAEEARRMPSQEALYRNYTLNQRVEARSPFVSRSLWQSCGAEPTQFDEDVAIYAGLDLSSVNDLTAFVPIAKIAGIWNTRPTFWLPAEGLVDKARKDRVPYDVWQKAGHLLTAPGKSVDYEFVAAFVWEFCQAHNVRKIAFDRWNFRHLKPWLIEAGFAEDTIEELFEEFGQGFQSMSPALRTLEGEILNGRIAHGNHPVLAMCAANAVVQSDPSGNRKLVKDKSSGRIDGMVALTMAMGVAPLDEGEVVATSPWDDPAYSLVG